TGHNNDQEIERDEIAFVEAGGIDEQRNDGYIGGHLEGAMPGGRRNPFQKDQSKDREGDPRDDDGQEVAAIAGEENGLRPNGTNRKNQGNGQETHTRQPIQPFSIRRSMRHALRSYSRASVHSPS